MKNLNVLDQQVLLNKEIVLERFPGKGGWTYAKTFGIKPDKSTPFNWTVVSGFIDEIRLSHVKLMPMGDGTLFLPVNKELRKKLGKKEGDSVRLILWSEHGTYKIPDWIHQCLIDAGIQAVNSFYGRSQIEQKSWVDWIEQARTDDLKIQKVITLMDHLERGLHFSQLKKTP